MLRAQLARQVYFGEDAVLVVMDTDGLPTFLSALSRAEQAGSSRLEVDRPVHDFLIQTDAADIELHDGHGASGAGHHYVDIRRRPRR